MFMRRHWRARASWAAVSRRRRRMTRSTASTAAQPRPTRRSQVSVSWRTGVVTFKDLQRLASLAAPVGTQSDLPHSRGPNDPGRTELCPDAHGRCCRSLTATAPAPARRHAAALLRRTLSPMAAARAGETTLDVALNACADLRLRVLVRGGAREHARGQLLAALPCIWGV